jgi:hypothetical protein
MTAFCIPSGTLHPMVCQYVSDKIGHDAPAFDPAMCASFAIFNSDKAFIGGVVITNYRDFDCAISVASETSLAWSDGVCRAVFTYVYDQLGCVRVTSYTKKSNKRCRAFLDGLGFQLEGTIRKGYSGKAAALVYGLLREECRWLGDYDDGNRTVSAAGRQAAGAGAEAAEAEGVEGLESVEVGAPAGTVEAGL